MQMIKIIEEAKTQLAEATKLQPLVVSGADHEDHGWRLTVDMVELERIPAAQDVIGTYEVRLSEDGELTEWRRTALRRRDETDLAAVMANQPAV